MLMLKKNYTILSIDTSCDETSAAVTVDDRVIANVISSQVELHKKWGGVVPDIARRAHTENIEPVVKEAFKKARIKPQNLDVVAVTFGPGLAIALEVGINKAKELCCEYHKPLIAVNHMAGHLFSSFAKNLSGRGAFDKSLRNCHSERSIAKSRNLLQQPIFPIIGLLVSGGHTQLVLVKDYWTYQLLGETLDDAAGEAFDKVAKMLKIGYPGGPIIEECAKRGDADRFKLPRPMEKSDDLDFSFAGLKTACLYKIRDLEKDGVADYTFDMAASFQRAVADSLTGKLKKAVLEYRVKQVVLGGGVISNLTVRKEIRRVMKKLGAQVFLPYSKNLCTDNAAMIGVAAWYQAQKGEFVKNIEKLDRNPVLNFTP